MRRLPLLLLLILSFAVWPVAGQDARSALDWVPADFDGVLRVDLSRPNNTLTQLNMAAYVASFLQPQRVVSSPTQRTLGDYFPVDLFDVEGAAFETTLLPLLSGEFIVAYQTLGADFAPDGDDVLLVLPTDDAFVAAAVLSTVTRAQDFAERTQYAGATIFRGDQTAIAFTPSAVLVGDVTLLQRALDVHGGGGARLSDDDGYAALTAKLDDWPVHAYLSGDAPGHALSVLLNGDASAQPMLQALGDALQPYNGDSLEAALLSGAVDALAVGLRADPLRGTVEARITVQTRLDSQATGTRNENDGVLTFIPRNAMLVQQGTDARGAFYDALVAAPTNRYFGRLLQSSFQASAAGPQVAPTAAPPDADDISAVVDGLLAALAGARGFDLDADLTTHLAGGYALALLPRPNNPARATGALVDVLLVAETGDAGAAVDGVIALAQALLALGDDAFSTAEGAAGVRTLFIPPDGEPVLQVGAVGGVLVVGTGGAVDAALRAGSGDNRLVNVARWQNVSRDAVPTLYLDLNALLATFAPLDGAPVQSGIGQLGLSVQPDEHGRYDLHVIVTLPQAA